VTNERATHVAVHATQP